MNAYELAQELHEDLQWIVTLNTDLKGRLALAINMLRQQADRIEKLEELLREYTAVKMQQQNRITELEKQLYFKDYYEELPETPVGFLNRGERVARQMPPPKGLIDPKSYYIGYEDGKKAPQTKPLSNSEIRTIQDMCHLKNVGYNNFIMRFARAIEAKVRGEK